MIQGYGDGEFSGIACSVCYRGSGKNQSSTLHCKTWQIVEIRQSRLGVLSRPAVLVS